ncbi:HDOD domain-containing protein [Chromatocurvus halotolerans]|uniref:HD-like signal output (HDOD) protein n=1 Tax=Chromatocurvus halotolerans TaxID=1132028 RepID=A0A4R2KRS5_9GAMM|nr:HDOD domain-containing protein [Chromatocurvus halotolerans]TCO69335.1 HD-like signal output (HDOD) protein [Chromatocurvus halotolerans]
MTLQIVMALCIGAAAVALWSLFRRPRTGSKPQADAPSRARRGAVTGNSPTRSAPLPQNTAAHLPEQEAPLSDTHSPPEMLGTLRLLGGDDISDRIRADIDAVCGVMPDPHPIHRQLASGLDSPEELAEIVASDAGLTASLLRNVNSAAFSLASPIISIRHAITYLGMSTVKGLVAQAAVAQQVESLTPEQQAALTRIWTSGCAASAVTQLLAQELGLTRPSVLATRALFLNLGDVALVMVRPSSVEWYAPGSNIVERICSQQNTIGMNTAMVGARLAQRWNLPDDISKAIQDGFTPLVTASEEYPMQEEARQDNVILYLAARIGDRVSYLGIQDVSDLDLRDCSSPDLFYLAGHLNATGLTKVFSLLEDATFRRKANRIIQTLSV